jgi:hypothetical protein
MTIQKITNAVTAAVLTPLHKIAVLALGVYTLIWGLWVASPFWSVFSQAELYSTLNSFAPEWAWGLLAIVCGVLIIWGAARMSYNSLLNGAQIAWGHWLLISIFYFLGDWHNTGGITSLFIAMSALWFALNIKVNFKTRGRVEDLFS